MLFFSFHPIKYLDGVNKLEVNELGGGGKALVSRTTAGIPAVCVWARSDVKRRLPSLPLN